MSFKKAIKNTTIAFFGFLLAAMLGQLDIVLSPWYGNPNNNWTFPFPFIFNRPISTLLAWEIIYGLIALSFFVVVFVLSLRDD